MINPADFYEILKNHEINCFAGVPDSLLKDFCAYITDFAPNHTICANEGNAAALACGHYLASKHPALVYMQNSGLGNIVNPLLSLADKDVYNIPLLLLIGWRGEPGVKDEPQHITQGKLTLPLLEVMGIEYQILNDNFKEQIEYAAKYMQDTLKPFALIVKKGTFDNYKLKHKIINNFELTREDAIKILLDKMGDDSFIISTTGYTSRELYEARQEHSHDFLTVGSMGHASSIALGIALNKPDKKIFCFDGDGALLMHMGAVPVIASKNLKNFKHIVFNNNAHDSVGAQPTASKFVNFKGFYKQVFSVSTSEELKKTLPGFIDIKETALLEIKVKCGTRGDLGRPKELPKDNKKIFMGALDD